MDLIKAFLSLRYISIIAVISSFIGAVLLFILGALKIAGALGVMLLSGKSVQLLIEAHGPESVTSGIVILVINAIDCFLFALILLIFSFGIYTLFVNSAFVQADQYPSWIKIESISQLKLYLTQVIITILFVQFLEISIVNGEHLDWKAIVLPFSILCLAGAIYLMHAGNSEH
ncbi:YqhA family protein [uncultured Methanospirillum sp.]|uniref:YqhA family protein n=1 Tax=uncultured Methanospirillum sp. TaxID=262503 RepID=UPI0029C95EF8|nr:YqhA family protein [uncultured Methanospirillum sp.]